MKICIKTWIYIGGLLTSLCAQYIFGQGTTKTVFPPGLEARNGNAALALFGGMTEYQQLFRAGTFSETSSGPIAITGLAFRLTEGAAQQFYAVIPSIEIRLSTTSRSPEQMSNLYELNKGGDERVVYSHSNVSLFAQNGQPINPFDLSFTFDQPFVYDVTQGNLLLFFDNPGSNTGGVG